MKTTFFYITTALTFLVMLQAPIIAQETKPNIGDKTEQTDPKAKADKNTEDSDKNSEDSKTKPAESEADKKKNEGIISLILRGGWTMLGLALISTVIIAFSIERYLFFKRKNIQTKGFEEKLSSLLEEGGINNAANALKNESGLLASIISYGLKHKGQGADGMEKAIERKATVEIGKLERGLNLLANFGNVAPLLGFFGTVVGMRASFLQFVIQKAPTAQDLAGGVEEALITTAAGLLVAIPTFLIYNLFIYQIDNLSTEVEDAAGQLRDAAVSLSSES